MLPTSLWLAAYFEAKMRMSRVGVIIEQAFVEEEEPVRQDGNVDDNDNSAHVIQGNYAIGADVWEYARRKRN